MSLLTYDIIFECSENNVVAHTTSDALNMVSIDNWDMNRPPDMARIPEIQSALKHQSYVDGIIYLSVNKTGDRYICYDGIHRLTALKNVRNKNIVIDLILSYSEDQIIAKFMRVNRCVPVPSLYTKAERELHLRETLETVVKTIQTTYPTRFSAASMPNIPNENRDSFMNKLSNEVMERTNKVTASSKPEDWLKYLNDLNDFTRDNIGILSPKLTPAQVTKCNQSKWYLFAVKNWQIAAIDRFERTTVV